MTATQLPLTFAQHHNNQQLFSDHYLNVTLPQRAEWQLLAADAREALQRISGILARFQPSQNEAQTEKDFVRPVLEALGHTFEVQAALRTPDGTKKPDYVFYHNQAALDANKNRVLDDATLQGRAFAVGDAKYWDRPLDITLKQASGDQFTNKNPAYQIAFYMQHSGTEWGILTNGRLWRLYHKDTAHKQNRFYEVDLAALVEANDAEAFCYFYAFFQRSAFAAGPISLAALLRESAAYARGVGESLKLQVYDALKYVAQGFLDYPGNGLGTDAATLRQIYDNSLIVLYRLLFILYAEARELLPMRESPEYRDDYSLAALVREIARRKQSGGTLLPTTARYWARLNDLFGMINIGNPPLMVATFNGGLFDPAKHPFLARYTVGDARLMEALDKLARVDGQFVDYRDLAERHLGTIYEGLLEYHLEPIQRSGVPAPDPQLLTPAPFTIDLFNDRGERHRTGSYYTPDFVVQYIVDQTLHPLLDAAVASRESDADKIAAVLAVNVLDMSMGSGHFPVAAVEYIARYLVDLGVVAGDEGSGAGVPNLNPEPDLAYWKRRVAQNCIYGVDLNPLAVDLAKLSLWLATTAKGKPLSFLDHHLRCGNALVGMRVAAIGVGGQGSGGRKIVRKRATSEPRTLNPDPSVQSSMLDDADFAHSMCTAVDSMWLIEGSAGDTVAEVREQERLYADLRETLTRKYQHVADLATARSFGVQIDQALWQPLVDYATGRSLAPLPKFAEWLQDAEQAAQQQRFFHYDLEFPEVFFDRHGQPLGERGGFDAVIGNPPYVRQEQLAPIKPYLQSAYGDVYVGTADLSVYFLAQGVHLLRRGGKVSYITSGTFRKLDFGRPLRTWLANNAIVDSLVSFGEQQIFTAATTYPVVITVRREPPSTDTLTNVYEVGSTETFTTMHLQQHYLPNNGAAWSFTAANLQHVLTGWNGSRPLREFLTAPIYRGVTTGLNDAFVISDAIRTQIVVNDPASAALIKPYISGSDLSIWYQRESNSHLIFARRGVLINSYQGVLQYLTLFKDKLEPRPKNLLPDAPWTGRKPGQYAWYEIQDSVEYFPVFESPRIHSTKISLHPTFSLLEPTAYAGNTSYVLPFGDLANGYYLLGILNSRVAEYYARNVFSPKANGYYEVQPEVLSQFPIPDASPAERETIGALAMQITAEATARYELHRKARRRIQNDLGSADKGLNQKLTAWWQLDFLAFRAEIQKVYKRDIALRDRDDWDEWLVLRRAEHITRTDAIVRLETDLNARVYALFDLTADEIKLIEDSTKYRYGEV